MRESAVATSLHLDTAGIMPSAFVIQNVNYILVNYFLVNNTRREESFYGEDSFAKSLSRQPTRLSLVQALPGLIWYSTCRHGIRSP